MVRACAQMSACVTISYDEFVKKFNYLAISVCGIVDKRRLRDDAAAFDFNADAGDFGNGRQFFNSDPCAFDAPILKAPRGDAFS